VTTPLPPLQSPAAEQSAPPAATEHGEPGVLSALQARVHNFTAKLSDAARTAAAATGIPEALILAQAALESGWGKREVRGDDGARTFNVFGIKADRSWTGAATEATTTEVVDGAPQRVKAKFRTYTSYQEAFSDYAKFLTSNPRYSAALSARDPTKIAHALQRAGYATDPDYAGKLVRVMNRLTSK
jgi:flagellar protein FlgJ